MNLKKKKGCRKNGVDDGRFESFIVYFILLTTRIKFNLKKEIVVVLLVIVRRNCKWRQLFVVAGIFRGFLIDINDVFEWFHLWWMENHRVILYKVRSFMFIMFFRWRSIPGKRIRMRAHARACVWKMDDFVKFLFYFYFLLESRSFRRNESLVLLNLDFFFLV